MNTLLYVFIFASNTCIAYVDKDSKADFRKESYLDVAVFDASALDDRLADKVFPAITKIGGVDAQCMN